MSAYELAQLNIATLKGAMDSPVMAEFAANLERINALADASPGFVWRLQDEAGDATAIRPFADEKLLVNMSVWRDIESLTAYVYSSAHTEFLRRRKEWFDRMREAHLVLWWVPAGQRPSVEEAIARLDALRSRGPGPDAFAFGQSFPPPDVTRAVKHEASAEDRDFRRAFEAFELPAGNFDHRAHVRLAYVYLCGQSASEAHESMKRALLAFLGHLGVGDAKYHETITRAWVMAVNHFMATSLPCQSAAAFIERNPVLLDKQIMLTHYSAEVLFSPAARAGFVAPDIQRIPEH